MPSDDKPKAKVYTFSDTGTAADDDIMNDDEDFETETDTGDDRRRGGGTTGPQFSQRPEPEHAREDDTMNAGGAAPEFRDPFILYDSDDQQAPEEEGGLGLINIEERSGNYVFTIGRAGRGKSTFQSHLLRYLYQAGDFAMQQVSDPDSDYRENDVQLRMWRESWITNSFPRRSALNRPIELRFKAEPVRYKRPDLLFGFFEFSGEDIRVFYDPDYVNRSFLSSLDRFLNNPKCKFTFIFLSTGDDARRDDDLFSGFLDHIYNNTKQKFRENASALLVIGYPEKAIKLLNNQPGKTGRRNGRLDRREYIATFLPNTGASLSKWNKRYGIAEFSVGKIGNRSENGILVPYIEKPSFEDAKRIFAWIYLRFTGQRPGPGFLTKLWKDLQN